MEFVRVASEGDLPEGEGRMVDVGDTEVALFNVGGRLYAMDNICLHRRGPLGEGTLEGTVVTCPLHGWQYDVRTGVHLLNEELKVDIYPLKVEDGEVYVAV